MNQRHIKIFADGADVPAMLALYKSGQVDGFTTNPTLMRKAGISDYESFGRSVVAAIPDLPISFEVFSDDFREMRRQAVTLAGWGSNVYVKVPITNTRGDFSAELIQNLADEGVKLNVTAILTAEQVSAVAAALNPEVPAVVSVFAGRIADTGVDPIPIMRQSRELLDNAPLAELLWASCREALNIRQAEQAGCHIITVTHELLKKRQMFGKCLKELSLETVKMFHDDAAAAGYRL